MNTSIFHKVMLHLVACIFLSLLTIQVNGQTHNVSEWVSLNNKGRLVYKRLPTGDKIMDFSHAGYMGGGVNIPSPAVSITVSPLPGNNTDAIQQAIDQVAKKKLSNGFRGTVLLKPGIYHCDRPIQIRESGIVLRGSGSGENGTVLNLTGKPHAAIVVRGSVATQPVG